MKRDISDKHHIQLALGGYLDERAQLTRRQKVLRQRCHRLRKLIQDINQLQLDLDNAPENR